MSQRNQTTTELYEFGPFRAEATERVLTKGQQVIPLTPKAFDTLVALLRNSGHVEKDELLKEVWPDTFVEEGVLAVNVAAIRKALSEGEEGHSYIETVPRRGYRFVGEVHEFRNSAAQDEPAAQKSEGRKQAWTMPWGLVAGLLALVIAGFIWFISRSHSTSIPPLSSPVPLTSYPGIELSPTFSPDGTQVAFSWDGERQDNFDIYVKLVDSSDAVRLTSNPASDKSPTWSPDGRQIAFVRDEAIFLITPLGGAERKLADLGANEIAWTRDGKSLLVSVGKSVKRRLVRLAAATGQPEQLILPPLEDDLDPSVGDLFPAVSPDGVSVEGPANQPSTRIEGVEPGAFRPVISLPPAASASRLAYARFALDTNIWVKPAAAATPAHKLVASTRLDTNPQFSPDGRKLAFRSERSGRSQIWVSNSDGSNPLQLTSLTEGYLNAPRWSPDGKAIVFAASQNNNQDIYSVSADGGLVHRLTSEPSREGRPGWSRDGRWIYFYSTRSRSEEIWRMPADGGDAVQLTTGGGHESYESPDGKVLYYEDFGIKGLKSLPIEAYSGPKEGKVVLGSVRPGFWTVAERGLYFVEFDSRDAGSQDVYSALLTSRVATFPKQIKFYDFQTHKVTQIGTIENDVLRGDSGFCATWDGTLIAWSQIDRRESDLMMIENFR